MYNQFQREQERQDGPNEDHLTDALDNILQPRQEVPSSSEPIVSFPGDEYGTWLGFHRYGRISFLTNYREDPSTWLKESISRGFLVRDFLLDHPSPYADAQDYINYIRSTSNQFNGYNLVLVDIPKNRIHYATNRTLQGFRELELENNKVYGVSNGVLADVAGNAAEWPKVERGKRLFQQSLSKQELAEALIQVLSDTFLPPQDTLPKGMFDEELEACLSSICVEHEKATRKLGSLYATRTHTVILVDFQDNVYFVEQDRYRSHSQSQTDFCRFLDLDTIHKGQESVVKGEYRKEFEFKLEQPN